MILDKKDYIKLGILLLLILLIIIILLFFNKKEENFLNNMIMFIHQVQIIVIMNLLVNYLK